MTDYRPFAVDLRLDEFAISLEARTKGRGTYLLCRDVSFYLLTEAIFGFTRDGGSSKPFHRLCSMMRKTGVQSMAIHRHVELEAYYTHKQYPAVIDEVDNLSERVDPARICVLQITFFSNTTPYNNLALPPSNSDDATVPDPGILASVVVLCIESDRPLPKIGTLEHEYMFEAVVEFPSFIVDIAAHPQTNTNSSSLQGEQDFCLRHRIMNNYHHVGDQTVIHVGGNEYVVECAYFCQQNGITSVCAHSAVKMVLWHTRENLYQPSTAKINAIVSSGHRQSFDPSRGLTIEEIRDVCELFGAKTIELDCRESQDIPPYEFAYGLVESGIPSFIVFSPTHKRAKEKRYHIMPVIGHTMNSDEWLPFAADQYRDMPLRGLHTKRYDTFTPSCEWASHLIVHDDMIGPYLCIGPSTLCSELAFHNDDGGRIHYVIGVLAKDKAPASTPYEAQLLGGRYISSLWRAYVDGIPQPWRDRLSALWERDDSFAVNAVVRTQIIRGDHYVAHLRCSTDHWGQACTLGKKERKLLRRKLPRYCWMVEFSLPHLFSANRSKLGEVLFSFEAPACQSNLTEASIEAPLVYRLINHIEMFDSNLDGGFTSHTKLYRRSDLHPEY